MPTAEVPPTVELPTEEPPTEEPPPPPAPTDWFDVSLDGMGHAYGYPRTILYRLIPSTMVVTFHNVGDQPVVAPTIRVELTEPEPPDGQPEGELSTHFIEAEGEGWWCDTTKGLTTCTTDASVDPGAGLPTIGIVVRPLREDCCLFMTRYTITLGDLLYEGLIRYDTSV